MGTIRIPFNALGVQVRHSIHGPTYTWVALVNAVQPRNSSLEGRVTTDRAGAFVAVASFQDRLLQGCQVLNHFRHCLPSSPANRTAVATRGETLLRGPTRSQELRLRRPSAADALSHQNPASFLHHRRYSVYDPTGLPNRAFLQRDRGCCMMQTNLNEPANTYKAPGSQWAHISAKVVVVPSLSPLFVLSVL